MSVKFRKQIFCPSTELLLQFERAELNGSKKNQVSAHLGNCEFCSAELQLLAAHPPTEAKCVAVEMPIALRELAEDLLGNRRTGTQRLRKLLGAHESLTIKSA